MAVWNTDMMAKQASMMPTAESAEITKAKAEAGAIAAKFKALKESGMFDRPKVGFMDRVSNALLAGGDSLVGTNNYANKMQMQDNAYKQQMDMAQQMMKQNEVDPLKEYTLGLKEDQWRAKITKDMGDDLDPAKSVRNALGVGQLGIARAERIEGLVNQYKDLNLDQRELKELAIGMNSLLQGSNISAQQQVKALTPKTVWGDANKLAEWLTNDPKGTQQQKFVQRMLNDVRREKQVTQNQVYDYLIKKVSKYNTIREKYPSDWEDIIRSQGINPERYDAWRKGGYKKNDVVGIFDLSNVDSSFNNSNSNSYDDPDKEARYQAWKAKQK